MGYFNICTEDKSAEGQSKAALSNIELWEELDSGGEYLISGFAKHQITNALDLLESGNLEDGQYAPTDTICDCEKNYGKSCKYPQKYNNGGCN